MRAYEFNEGSHIGEGIVFQVAPVGRPAAACAADEAPALRLPQGVPEGIITMLAIMPVRILQPPAKPILHLVPCPENSP